MVFKPICRTKSSQNFSKIKTATLLPLPEFLKGVGVGGIFKTVLVTYPSGALMMNPT
jgi:hypothetical protein